MKKVDLNCNFITFQIIYFCSVHLTAYHKKINHIQSLKTTENISRRTLSLPMYPNMKKEEIQLVYEAITEFFEKNRQ